MKSLLRVVFVSALTGVALAAEPFDAQRVAEITGLTGAWNSGRTVYKVSAPRIDLPVTVDGWSMPPFMGLTSWAAFTAGQGPDAMVMGDLVLFEDEVNPVMSALLDAGLEVTALHNHFFFDEPRVYFLHLGGEGPIERLATGVKLAFAGQRDVRTANPTPGHSFGGPVPAASSIGATALEAVFGGTAQTKDGMVKFVFGRETSMDCGCKVGADMGVNTWAAFAGTDDDAVVDGDFAVLESELQPVLKTLRAQGINIVAIHSHMTGETPRILFLHYWGRGKAADLAAGLKKAMSTQTK